MGRTEPRTRAKLRVRVRTVYVFGAACALLEGPGVAAGCLAPVEARLRPVWGCGLEGQALTGVQVRARGDFPVGTSQRAFLSSGQVQLQNLPAEVDGITVEGLFGEQVVLAVGRTLRLAETGELPVYFAAPDSVCPVPNTLAPRVSVAAAVSSAGDLLAVGGEDADGELLSSVARASDAQARFEVRAQLDAPTTGHAVTAIGPHAFLRTGGASLLGPLRTVQRIELPPQSSEIELFESVAVEGEAGRAFHGAVRVGTSDVLVQGGCVTDEAIRCPRGQGAVLRSGFFVRTGAASLSFAPAPSLTHARYGHRLLRASDDVVFAVGGHDDGGQPVLETEVLLPGANAWARYGPSLFEAAQGQAIVGATLLEGGLVVLVLEDGTVWRVDQHHLESLPNWCQAREDPCFARPAGLRGRSLIPLAGERVRIDGWLLPVAGFGRTGFDGRDLSAPSPGQNFQPPASAQASSLLGLDDGTVIAVGGVADDGRAAEPMVTRLRPALDGPDEGTPDLSDPLSGALTLHDEARTRISAAPQTLVLDPDPQRQGDVAATWVHVRGFRSQRFVIEGAVEALNGAPELRLVFSAGAVARHELAVGPERVRWVAREATGETFFVTCSSQGATFAGVGQAVRIDVTPEAVTLMVGGTERARCPGLPGGPVAVGFGALGAGTLRLSALRLSRI